MERPSWIVHRLACQRQPRDRLRFSGSSSGRWAGRVTPSLLMNLWRLIIQAGGLSSGSYGELDIHTNKLSHLVYVSMMHVQIKGHLMSSFTCMCTLTQPACTFLPERPTFLRCLSTVAWPLRGWGLGGERFGLTHSCIEWKMAVKS